MSRATATTSSPSSRRWSRTPRVARPLTLISLTGQRITTPAFVVTRRCSSGRTIWTVTTCPFAYFGLVVRTPFEPRRVFRYSASVVRFPKPLLRTVRSPRSESFERAIETTSSPVRTRIPATPAAHRPDLGNREPVRVPARGREDDLHVPVLYLDVDELVTLV